MTYARAHLVDAENGGIYHCISRCVRRAWLCGQDPLTGQCFEHRREWIEQRLLKLATIFSVELFGYAVMNNHYHVVLDVQPKKVRSWSDESVAKRWCALGPQTTPEKMNVKVEAILHDADRLRELRSRLGSLSWFMRYINEPIARRANREDDTKGRFWEGRFKSIGLLDRNAAVTCIAYVDLNPVRAGLATGVEDAMHTSVRRRLQSRQGDAYPLSSLAGLGLTRSGYIALLRWTIAADHGQAAPPSHGAARSLSHLQQSPDHWLGRVKAHRFKYRAYGALNLLRDYAESLGLQWLRGAKPGLAAPD